MIDNLPPTLTRIDPATKRSAEYVRADCVAAWRKMSPLWKRTAKHYKRLAEIHAYNHGEALARIEKLEASLREVMRAETDDEIAKAKLGAFLLMTS